MNKLLKNLDNQTVFSKILPFFRCTMCGECCKQSPELDNLTLDEVKITGIKNKELGSPCRLLLSDKKCLIHDNKPRICKIEPFSVHVFVIGNKKKVVPFVHSKTAHCMLGERIWESYIEFANMAGKKIDSNLAKYMPNKPATWELTHELNMRTLQEFAVWLNNERGKSDND